MSDYHIIEALNLETGQPVNAADYFSQPEETIWQERLRVERVLQQEARHVYVCPYCHQPLVIRGQIGGVQTMHFRHKIDSDDCPLKTGIEMTPDEMLARKFNGARESQAHRAMKQRIITSLAADASFSQIQEERNFRISEELAGRFRPDVQAIYGGTQRVVFEVQLSTTFLSVIVKRDLFYKSQNTFIVWVFSKFSDELQQQRFTEKDILYANRNNIFIVDDDTVQQSIVAGELVLRCHVLSLTVEQGEIVATWEKTFVKFSELTFDTQEYRVYWKDVNAQYVTCLAEQREQRRLYAEKQAQRDENLRRMREEREAQQRRALQLELEQEAQRNREEFQKEGDALAERIRQKHAYRRTKYFKSN